MRRNLGAKMGGRRRCDGTCQKAGEVIAAAPGPWQAAAAGKTGTALVHSVGHGILRADPGEVPAPRGTAIRPPIQVGLMLAARMTSPQVSDSRCRICASSSGEVAVASAPARTTRSR